MYLDSWSYGTGRYARYTSHNSQLYRCCLSTPLALKGGGGRGGGEKNLRPSQPPNLPTSQPPVLSPFEQLRAPLDSCQLHQIRSRVYHTRLVGFATGQLSQRPRCSPATHIQLFLQFSMCAPPPYPVSDTRGCRQHIGTPLGSHLPPAGAVSPLPGDAHSTHPARNCHPDRPAPPARCHSCHVPGHHSQPLSSV